MTRFTTPIAQLLDEYALDDTWVAVLDVVEAQSALTGELALFQ